jgi:hypothetical protein
MNLNVRQILVFGKSTISVTKGSLSYRLCFEYFSQFKIDSETYTYLAAVLKDGDVSEQVKLRIWKLFWSKSWSK